MVATRYSILLFLLQFSFLNLTAQDEKKTYSFVDRVWVDVVKEVVEDFGLYLSYDPKIIDSDRLITARYNNQTLEKILQNLTGDAYRYQIIGDYVVLTKKPIVFDVLNASPRSADVVRDTIKEVLTVYDTQVVTRYDVVYDTILIEQKRRVYDTIQVEREWPVKDYNWSPYLAPSFWLRTGDGETSLYKGIRLGLGFHQKIQNWELSLSADYGYYSENRKYSETRSFEEQQIDTISTFYVIEDGQRIPVYITDTSTVTRSVDQIYDRSNVVQPLSLHAGAARYQHFKRLSLGFSVNIGADWLLDVDEVLTDNKDSNPTPDYSSLLWNVTGEIPIVWRRDRELKDFYLAPYLQWGLNNDFANMDLFANRYRFGLKMGIYL